MHVHNTSVYLYTGYTRYNNARVTFEQLQIEMGGKKWKVSI